MLDTSREILPVSGDRYRFANDIMHDHPKSPVPLGAAKN
jgi:hypothetical protein